MSVHKTTHGYVVRWREGTKNRQRTVDRHADARRWDDETRRRRQLGTLATLNTDVVTLNDYAANTWAPTYRPLLATRTRQTYAHTYDDHIAPRLGHLGLHAMTPPVVAKWQAAVLPSGHEALVKARAVLSTILQSAAEAGLIPTNPVRSVRASRAPLKAEVRPLAPASVEALRSVLSDRGATLLSLCSRTPGFAPERPARCAGATS